MWAASARLHAVASRVCGLNMGMREVKCQVRELVRCGDVRRACALTVSIAFLCPIRLQSLRCGCGVTVRLAGAQSPMGGAGGL